MLTDQNYIVIQAWMRTKLGLSGPKLLCYACIWGFSQGDKGAYTGGQEYLQEWTGCDERTIRRALSDLCAAGLITKSKLSRTNVYRATPVDRREEDPPRQEGITIITKPDEECRKMLLEVREQPDAAAVDSTSIPDILTGIDDQYRTFCPKIPDILTGVNINNININKGIPKQARAREENAAAIPTREEIRAYCIERGNGIDPDRFFEAYEAVGWIIHGSHVKDWKALVRKWETFPQTPRGRGRPRKNRALDYMHGPKMTDDRLKAIGITLGEEFYDDGNNTAAVS